MATNLPNLKRKHLIKNLAIQAQHQISKKKREGVQKET